MIADGLLAMGMYVLTIGAIVAVAPKLRRKPDRAGIRSAPLQATRTAAAVFTVLIGALLFGYFLTIAKTPQKLTGFLTGLGIGRYGVLALIM